MKIDLGRAETGEQVSIDIPTLVSTRLLVTASSGGGKSETLRRILEEAVGHIQCVVIDPEGEFSTLREKKPFVLVGEGGETPADIRTAALVATRLLELNASAVCDIYELKVHERHEWVKRFLDAMVRAPKSLWHPVLVVIDEAHTYCPERGYGESVASQSIIDICNLGRKRGFCAVLATQRLSKLNKNAVEPLQNYLVGRTTYDDQQRAASTFKVAPGAETRKFSLELERLKDGQFICRGRALTGDMLKVQVTRGETRPPKTGTAMAGVVTPTPDSIKALLPKLADLPHEAEKKAKTEADLRQELSDGHRRIQELERNRPDPEEIIRLRQQRDSANEALIDERVKVGILQGYVDAVLKIQVAAETMAPLALLSIPKPVVSMEPRQAIRQPIQYDRPTTPKPSPANGNGNLRSGARRMLTCLVQWYPSGRTESQVAAQVQMKKTGGTWGTYKSDLKKGGYFEERDGLWFATDVGMAYIGADAPETPSTTEEVVRLWGAKLRSGARKMLDALVAHRGRNVSRDALGEAVDMEPGGGTFGTYLSDLKQAGLIIVDRDGVRANRETLLL